MHSTSLCKAIAIIITLFPTTIWIILCNFRLMSNSRSQNKLIITKNKNKLFRLAGSGHRRRNRYLYLLLSFFIGFLSGCLLLYQINFGVKISDLDRNLGPVWLEALFLLWSVIWPSPEQPMKVLASLFQICRRGSFIRSPMLDSILIVSISVFWWSVMVKRFSG